MPGNPPEDRANDRPAFTSEDADFLRWYSSYPMTPRGRSRREEDGIREYGMRPFRVSQKAIHLIDHPDAVGYNNGEVAPIVRQLQRYRDQQKEKRA